MTEPSLKGLILELYDEEGNYYGPNPRVIVVNGVGYQIDQYAQEHGFTLPDSE